MNEPILYAVASMVCYGMSDFIYKRGAMAGLRAEHFLMAQAWFFTPLVIGYAWFMGRLIATPAALWGSAAGVLILIGFTNFIRSLATGSISTNASIFRMNFIITVLLVAAFLGEPLTAQKLAGLALALLATWLLVGDASAAKAVPNPARSRSLMQVGIATLAFGASTFCHTMGLRHGALPETLAVAQAALFMPLATLVVYLRERTLRIPPVTFRYGAVAALALFGATISLLRGVRQGEASVLVPIAQMGFIIAALLGVVILRERLTIRKTAGLVAALGALAVLASI